MPDTAAIPARLVIQQPEEVRSFWQPVPANGFVRCILDSAMTGAETPFAMGTQTVDPGCHVREHLHDANEEVIFVQSGEGEAHVEGAHPSDAAGQLLLLPARPAAQLPQYRRPRR